MACATCWDAERSDAGAEAWRLPSSMDMVSILVVPHPEINTYEYVVLSFVGVIVK